MTIANPHLNDSGHKQHIHSLKKWATVASLSVATLLVTVKFMAYMITDSVSMLSSLMDSGFDGLASTVAMIGVAHASTPADEEHRFGHGKIEAVTAFGQAIFITASAGFLLFESVHRFFQPVLVKDVTVGYYVMGTSIVLTIGLILFQQYVIRKTSSIAINADHLHYKGDLYMNISVILSLFLTQITGFSFFDPLFGGAIGLFLLYGAYSISRESFGVLIDRELPEETRKNILDLVGQHRDVHAVHDLRTRTNGHRDFIEFHLEIDGNMPLTQAHAITEDLEKTLYAAFPKAEVLIHQEPAGIQDHRHDHQVDSKT